MLSTQGEQLDFISKRLKIDLPHLFSDPHPVIETSPSIYLAHNSFLHTKSPPPKASKKAAASEEVKRDFYGGKGDLAHLGGFTQRDNHTISENLWNFMLSQLAVKSIVDVGCGKGFSTSYFLDKGAKVLCIEGSKDAIANSVLPSNVIVEHDFSRGPWWPSETYDVAWSTEFLEHVGRQYMRNYMPVFAKSALVFVTASGWGGWHHVEVHDQKWWIGRFQSMGFIFSKELTEWVRYHAKTDLTVKSAQTLVYGLMVFINPSVASLPRHQHLFGGNGCYRESIDNRDGGKACDGPDTLPDQYKALLKCSKPSNLNTNEEYESTLWTCSKEKDSSSSSHFR